MKRRTYTQSLLADRLLYSSLGRALVLLGFLWAWPFPLHAQQDGVIDDPGDIVIIAYYAQTNNVNGDGFSFLFTDDCPPGTSIRFTDEGWDQSLVPPAFNSTTNEGDVLWTNNTGCTIPKGTVVDIMDADDGKEGGSSGIRTSIGTVSEDDLGFDLAQSKDQIYAFTGTRSFPGNFLAFYGSNKDGNSDDADLPSSLTDGTTALVTGNNPSERYTGSTVCNWYFDRMFTNDQ